MDFIPANWKNGNSSCLQNHENWLTSAWRTHDLRDAGFRLQPLSGSAQHVQPAALPGPSTALQSRLLLSACAGTLLRWPQVTAGLSILVMAVQQSLSLLTCQPCPPSESFISQRHRLLSFQRPKTKVPSFKRIMLSCTLGTAWEKRKNAQVCVSPTLWTWAMHKSSALPSGTGTEPGTESSPSKGLRGRFLHPLLWKKYHAPIWLGFFLFMRWNKECSSSCFSRETLPEQCTSLCCLQCAI